jgi:hypothetical protein
MGPARGIGITGSGLATRDKRSSWLVPARRAGFGKEPELNLWRPPWQDVLGGESSHTTPGRPAEAVPGCPFRARDFRVMGGAMGNESLCFSLDPEPSTEDG